MKLKRVLQVLCIAFGLFFLSMVGLLHVERSTRAQGNEVTLTKSLNRAGSVVRVGEVLSFTIALTNNAAFSLTHVTLLDDYNQGVLAFAGAVPSPDNVITGTGSITWTNVATPPIQPGQNLTFTLYFTAEHPQTVVVNYARAEDIIGAQQAISDATAQSRDSESIGGAAPVFKAMSPPDFTPQAQLPVTFTHIITNDGAATMTFLPLTDTYNAAFLEFNFAVPTPTITSPGQLVWTDLTTCFGNIPPFATVVVTTVFTATTQVVDTVNEAGTQGARDEYSNDLAGGVAWVPITIIDDNTNSGGDSGDNNDDDDDTPVTQPTATPVMDILATPTAVIEQEVVTVTAMITAGPRYLPETGYREPRSPIFLILTVLIILVGSGFWLIKKVKEPHRNE